MREAQTSSALSQNPNPGAVAIVDLMALVAGVGLVLPLRELTGKLWVVAAGVTEPWATWVKIGEFASKLNIALVVVLLVRHVRFGTVFRATEWLMIAIAMRSLHWRLAYAGGRDWATRWIGWSSGHGDFRAWYTLGLIGFLAVIAVLTAFRRRMPLWLRLPLFVMLPLFALWGPAIFASNELNIRWHALWPTAPVHALPRAGFMELMQSPEHVLVCLPFVAAVSDLRRRGRAAWRWEVWTGLGLVLLLASTEILITLTAHIMHYPEFTLRLEVIALWAGSWLVEVVVAVLIVRRLGGLWIRLTSPLPSSTAAGKLARFDRIAGE